MRDDVRQYAADNKLRLDRIERHKLLMCRIPDFGADVRAIFYLPFDEELRDSVITNIQGAISEIGPTDQFPFNWPEGATTVATANIGNYIQWTMNIVLNDGQIQWENLPMYYLLQTNAINNKEGIDCCLQFMPGKSYFTFFDVGNVKGDFFFPLLFKFHKIIP